LSDDDQKELQIYKEKVVDLEIEYNPVVAENFNLIFNSGQDHYKFLLNKMEVLDLKNIRILKMIKRNIDSLAYFNGWNTKKFTGGNYNSFGFNILCPP
jgi:hypothetical protein